MSDGVTETADNFVSNSSELDERIDVSQRVEYDTCSEDFPTTAQLIGHFPIEGQVLAVLLVLFSLMTLLIYIEEIIFIRKRIRRGTRTMWFLACFPVYSITGVLSVFVPRCGAINDMIASGFFATCLYNFGRLMVRYMGGTKQLWKVFETGRMVSFRTLPVCCCCFCFPLVPFRLRVYNAIRALVMQVAIVRPLLTFVGVVLYADGTFKPGVINLRNPYTYITVGNAVSTMLAVYGMMILRGVFRPELESQFKLSGKVMCVQLALFLGILPKGIIVILVATEVIQCGPVFPSTGRGEMINHAIVVLISLPLSLLAQHFFRRSSDGDSYFDQKAVATSASGFKMASCNHDAGDLPDKDARDDLTTLSFSHINGGETIV